MSFNQEEIRANREHFAHKLHAEKQRNDVVKAVEGNIPYDFVLLDTRGHQPYTSGHIPGAWSVPETEVEKYLSLLPKDKELVTYCWSHD